MAKPMLDYVLASAALLDVPLDAARASAVAQVLARTAAMAQQLEQFALDTQEEPCALYCPAPFPAGDGFDAPDDAAAAPEQDVARPGVPS